MRRATSSCHFSDKGPPHACSVLKPYNCRLLQLSNVWNAKEQVSSVRLVSSFHKSMAVKLPITAPDRKAVNDCVDCKTANSCV